MTNAADIQPIACVLKTQQAQIPYLQGEGASLSIINISGTKSIFDNNGRKKAAQSLWGVNKSGNNSGNLPARICTDNHRWVNSQGHGIPTPNQTHTKMNSRNMDNIFANEIGRLAQGVGRNIKGTNKIYFIKHQETPMNQKSTDGRMVVDCCPQKEEQ